MMMSNAALRCQPDPLVKPGNMLDNGICSRVIAATPRLHQHFLDEKRIGLIIFDEENSDLHSGTFFALPGNRSRSEAAVLQIPWLQPAYFLAGILTW